MGLYLEAARELKFWSGCRENNWSLLPSTLNVIDGSPLRLRSSNLAP